MRLPILFALTLTLLSAEPREALLIGNSNYKHITNLDDPSSNLNRLKTTLKGLDFKVKIKTDLNSEDLEASIDNFAKRLSKSSDSIGLLYYTGHGCQVDYQGYLVPTNVNTKIKRKIKYNAMNINEMLETLKDAGNRVNMVFLDACRDVPTGAKGGTKGLGQPVARPKGSLIVYATEAGKVADDNSKFINSLIDNISKPNQKIEVLGSSISRDVAKQSQYSQIPEVYVKLLPENFVLKRGRGRYVPPVEPVVPVPQPVSSSKWIVPSNSVCKANGGKLDRGVCQANWVEATKICSASGARLLSREDLHKVIRDCGGIVNNDFSSKDAKKNRKNSHYQNCYKQKGFSDNDWYWTSESRDSSRAWFVGFSDGFDFWNIKTDLHYALCVR